MLSYEPLIKTLHERNITLLGLQKMLGTNTSCSYLHSPKQTTASIARICKVLNCNIEDVVCWVSSTEDIKIKKGISTTTYNVNWDKLYKIIKEKKMTVTSVSIAMGKSFNYLPSRRKQGLKCRRKVVDLICQTVGCKLEDFCDEV